MLEHTRAIFQRGEVVPEAIASRRARADVVLSRGAQPGEEQLLHRLAGALARELVSVLRSKRHYYIAAHARTGAVAVTFLSHADDELAHADAIANRIAERGGAIRLDAEELSRRSRCSHDRFVAHPDISTMLREDLFAERVAIDGFSAAIECAGDDVETRDLLARLLAEAEAHTRELTHWLRVFRT